MTVKNYNDLVDKVVHNITKMKNIKGATDVIYKTYLDNKVSCQNKKKVGKKLRILLLNSTANGFGDIIAVVKFALYLREWYDPNITIASTTPSGFKLLGEKLKVLTLKPKKGKDTQGLKFAQLKLTNNIPEQDLIFVVPLIADFDPVYSDVKKLLPYSNKMNTFFVSEYNHPDRTNITFPTGIGTTNMGILMTKFTVSGKVATVSKVPYAVAYVAGGINGAFNCVLGFMEMVASKYHKTHKVFDVVVPGWVSEEILELAITERNVVKKVGKYYPNIVLVTPKKKKIWLLKSDSKKNVINIRADVLPVKNIDMIRLMRNSVNEILLTGDQSITDAISCCSKKNIFYQIAPWKENFGSNLAKYLPQKYLKAKKTSCGTLSALKYDSNYSTFLKRWDFRINAKPVLDAVIMSAVARRENKNVKTVWNLIINSKTLASLKKKLKQTIYK